MDKKVRRLQLLLCYDRGLIWSKHKEDFKNNNTTGWTGHLKMLGFWPQKIQGYINFYELVEEFPRILISTAAWSQWLEFMTQFKTEMTLDVELRSKVSQKLNMALNGADDTDNAFQDVMNDLANLQTE